MSTFIKELIINKMKQLTPNEIRNYAKEYGFHISKNEAEEIAKYIKTKKIDPFNKKDHKKMLQELARITDTETAKKANKLFNEMVKAYGLESLFK
ncbi:DUF2624 family protein [Ornithinibacillus sp. L9]|uniref:DUF2624 family protein n=1 Tax=Ornithinibacillus caprae TaxID=2678566 RepID=A0A6N8FH90_9BACI|nr:DUF2624 domain-containing protein [Ornithinibacillus caprae]MUK87109.1 DUF2624 family protein [Ornithinibacillus caprae]